MRKNQMKAWAFAAMAVLCAGTLSTSCSSDDDVTTSDNRNWGTDGGFKSADNLLFENNTIGNGDQNFVFTGTQTLKKGTYTLKGWVYVAKGAKLTIEPGTIIKGDKQTKASLIVEPGGQIFAQGTASEPIVFTSEEAAGNRRPGDWGGVIVCGEAPNNNGVLNQQIEGGPRTKHGGTKADDNSGVLSYVRIEFAGYPFEKDQEINGLTLGSVGSATKIDHIQVSYSNDDSYEWFGGTVNCNHLVAFKGWDDDFDTDNGFSGKVQFGFVVRDPKLADVSQANSFESDNNKDGSAAEPYTTATFSNMTFVGPMVQDANFVNDASYINGGNMAPNNGSSLGKFQAAMQIRRNSRLSCFNSIAVGYPIGLILDNEKVPADGNGTQQQATAGNLKLQNIWFAGMGITGSDANKVYKDNLVTTYGKNPELDETKPSFSSQFFTKAENNNAVKTLAELMLGSTNAFKGLTVSFLPQAGSPVLNAASFADPKVSNGFEKVSYIGAFGTDANWLNGWTNFDPENTVY